MNNEAWKAAYAELADKYFEATGELICRPVNPDTGKESQELIISAHRLRTLYLDEKMSMKEIARLLQCSDTTVKRILIRFNIPPRPRRRKESGGSGTPGLVHRGLRAGAASHERRINAGYEFGGKEYKKSDGYVKVYAPEHPFAKSKYVARARLVMEQHLGRYLRDDEVVHHINHIRYDDRIENLALMNKTEHYKMHLAEAAKAKLESPGKVNPEKLIEMHSLGLTDGEIAQRLGVSLRTIWGHRTKLALPANRRRRMS